MTLQARLTRLAARVPRLPPPPDPHPDVWFPAPILDLDVLSDLDDMVPTAVVRYHDAVAAARASKSPPYDPPKSFLPKAPVPERRLAWRTQERFPAVWAGWRWLHAARERIEGGRLPPADPAAFADLAAWFTADEDALARLVDADGLLDLRDGRQTTLAVVKTGARRGPRDWWADRAQDDLVKLRAVYDEAWTPKLPRGSDGSQPTGVDACDAVSP